MEFMEVVKQFMGLRTSWVFLGIGLIILMVVLYSILTAAKRADELLEVMRCRNKKRADKKQKSTAGLSDTSGQLHNGTKASSKNLKTAELSTSQEVNRTKELIQWKKYRCLRRMKPKGT